MTDTAPTEPPPFARGERKARGKMREGQLYEDAVQVHLAAKYGDFYVSGPWFKFWTQQSERPRFCQPDGLIFDTTRRIITCVEIKLKHTTDAWWQIRHLYHPVLSQLFPPEVWELRACEVVRWYDPDVCFPENVALVPDPLALQGQAFGVHIWNNKM